jgi:hypothetical protein
MIRTHTLGTAVALGAIRFSPEEVDASMPRWKRVYDELVR